MLASAERAGLETGVRLGMRIGLHSGPVVAGVIRADKSRFQLFGDTARVRTRPYSNARVRILVFERSCVRSRDRACPRR
jgi:class 3 adenylate cyclase